MVGVASDLVLLLTGILLALRTNFSPLLVPEWMIPPLTGSLDSLYIASDLIGTFRNLQVP